MLESYQIDDFYPMLHIYGDKACEIYTRNSASMD